MHPATGTGPLGQRGGTSEFDVIGMGADGEGDGGNGEVCRRRTNDGQVSDREATRT
jgi:hypothetical protein